MNTFWVPQSRCYTESNFRSEFPYIDDDTLEGSTDQIAMTTRRLRYREVQLNSMTYQNAVFNSAFKPIHNWAHWWSWRFGQLILQMTCVVVNIRKFRPKVRLSGNQKFQQSESIREKYLNPVETPSRTWRIKVFTSIPLFWRPKSEFLAVLDNALEN